MSDHIVSSQSSMDVSQKEWDRLFPPKEPTDKYEQLTEK